MISFIFIRNNKKVSEKRISDKSCMILIDIIIRYIINVRKFES